MSPFGRPRPGGLTLRITVDDERTGRAVTFDAPMWVTDWRPGPAR